MLWNAGLLVALLLPAPARSPRLETMIDDYGRTYRAESGSIEALYDLSRTIGDSLLSSDLEDLPAAQFDSLAARLPGMVLVRGDFLLVAADVPAYRALARARGDSTDVDFFETLFAVEDSSFWPNYELRQTDHSGCTRFGSGDVVAAYSAWVGFGERHPGRYRRWAEEGSQAAYEELITSTCPCGDRRSVIRELEMFLGRYPSGPGFRAAYDRLKELRRGTGKLREHCISG